MLNDRIPFFLSEAQVSLYRADTSGQPAGNALWLGGFANRLSAQLDYEGVTLKASGARYAVTRHVDEAHALTFGQSWLIPRATMTDWKPGRDQQYVLQLLWQSERQWFRRTYYGVTWNGLKLDAANTNQFLVEQSLRAQSYTDDSGSLAAPVPPVVTAPATGVQQPLGFFRENVLIAGEYLLGLYQFSGPVTLVRASVIAWAPQTSPCVLGLEVNGTLTGQTLTIPVGTPLVEVTANVTLTGVVPAGQFVRWKILSAPSPADGAWNCAVVMNVSG
jgi:hypothetical protein